MKKQHFVTITSNGKKYTALVYADLDKDGKLRINKEEITKMLDKLGVKSSDTYTIG